MKSTKHRTEVFVPPLELDLGDLSFWNVCGSPETVSYSAEKRVDILMVGPLKRDVGSAEIGPRYLYHRWSRLADRQKRYFCL